MASKPSSTDRRTARYEKLCSMIERAQGRFEKYDRLAKRAIKQLASLERTRTRLRKAIDKAERETANAAVVSTVEARVETTPVESFVQRGQAAQAAVDAELAKLPKVRAKRQRKAPPGSERAALHHVPPSGKAHPESREARMEAMGFRKTGKRRS